MIHLTLFLNLISLFLGISAVFTTLLVYFKEKRISILFYSINLIALFSQMFGITLRLYFTMNGLLGNTFLHIFYFIFAKGGIVVLILTVPLFTHLFFEIKLTKQIIVFIIIYAFTASIFAVLKFFYYNSKLLIIILSFQLLSVFIYMLINGLIHIKNINSEELQKSILAFFVISILMIPALTPIHFLAPYFFTFFYIVLSVLSIIFSFNFFLRMPFFTQIEITESFRKRYYITGRESEIISLLIKGLSNKEIGERLFISIKTVKNHITNIYQKTNTKNRLQLYNILYLTGN